MRSVAPGLPPARDFGELLAPRGVIITGGLMERGETSERQAAVARRRWPRRRAATLLLAAAAATGLAAPDAEPITPIGAPAEAPDRARIALGERLFGDRRLSHGDRVACTSCH